MTINRFLLPIAAAALSVLTPIAAQAAQFVITYRGTFLSGGDNTGAFGAQGTDFTNAAFTAIYFLNTSTVGATTRTDGLTFSEILGGTRANTVSPVSASLTINGFTRAINGLASGEARLQNSDPGLSDSMYHGVAEENSNTTSFTSNYMYHTVEDGSEGSLIPSVNWSSSSWGSSFIYNPSPNNNTGYFQFSTRNNTTGNDEEYAQGLMNIESVTVASVGAIPEPATWLMMIVGFGMVGASIRSTRRQSSGALASV